MKRFREWLDIPKILYHDREYWIRFNAERSALLNQETVLSQEQIIERSQMYPPAYGSRGYEEALRSYAVL